VNRRAFLAGAGATLSLGLVGEQSVQPPEPTVVRVWFSEAAATYDGLAANVEGYLGAALEPAIAPVEFDFVSQPLSISAEGGRSVLGTHWPARVFSGAVRTGGVDPVDGVNLLVTDGDPTKQPSGFARPHVAAATGAESIARMPPVDDTPTVVPYSVRAAATQVVLHEVAHALGADHEHGAVRRTEDALVASPMIGSYLWASEAVRERQLPGGTACGGAIPDETDSLGRRLRMRYADCALEGIADESR
jgi:hypothetical protein